MESTIITRPQAAEELGHLVCNEQCNTEGQDARVRAAYAAAIRRLRLLAGELVDSDREALSAQYRHGIANV